MGSKQEKKEAGAQSSSSSHKAGIARSHARLGPKKLRRVLKNSGQTAAETYAAKNGLMPEFNRIVESGLTEQRGNAAERRRKVREARRDKKIADRERAREQARLRDAADKAAAEKKAKRQAAALKGAATRRANKAAATIRKARVAAKITTSV